MLAEEHKPVRAAILGPTALGQCEKIRETDTESDRSSNERDQEEDDEAMPSEKQKAAKKRMEFLFQSDAEDPFSRTRGIASSKYQLNIGSHGQVQSAARTRPTNAYYDPNDSDANDEEEDTRDIFDENRYRLRSLNRQGSDVSEEEELADIERLGSRFQLQVPSKSSGRQGAVNKFKNQIRDARSKFAPSDAYNNHSLQDNEDNYSDDTFEQDDEQSGYFMGSELQQRATPITHQFRDQMIDSLDNPLMYNNKFFYVKQQLNRLFSVGLNEHSDLEKVENQSVKFFKNLNSFITLPIVSFASHSLICTATSRMESFQSKATRNPGAHRFDGRSTEDESPNLGAVSIPIKRKLYERLFQHFEGKNWEDLIKSEEPQPPTASAS